MIIYLETWLRRYTQKGGKTGHPISWNSNIQVTVTSSPVEGATNKKDYYWNSSPVEGATNKKDYYWNSAKEREYRDEYYSK
jgi:hypothetical protein